MLTTVELRHLVEQSFLPTRCECSIDLPVTLTVRFYHGSSNREILVVTGISVAQVSSAHTIVSLVADLRSDLERVSSGSCYTFRE